MAGLPLPAVEVLGVTLPVEMNLVPQVLSC